MFVSLTPSCVSEKCFAHVKETLCLIKPSRFTIVSSLTRIRVSSSRAPSDFDIAWGQAKAKCGELITLGFSLFPRSFSLCFHKFFNGYNEGVVDFPLILAIPRFPFLLGVVGLRREEIKM